MRAGWIVIGLAILLSLARCFAREEQPLELVEVCQSRIEVAFDSAPDPPLRKLVMEWVATSAHAVCIYYQKFPVNEVRINIRFFNGHGVRSGFTQGWNGPSIRIAVGNSSSGSDFVADWELTHEMVHLAFPSVADAHHWIEEGSATYVEPIARARAGDLTPEKVWGDLVDGLPRGLPGAGDQGLDHTPTWGRTYWGGALFCLLADIDIRKRTNNRKGLEDALRGIIAAGGTIDVQWPLINALRIGDDATGVPVLRELYEKMKDSPSPVDLNAIWTDLGVQKKEGGIRFNDSAPLATVRRAITSTKAIPAR